LCYAAVTAAADAPPQQWAELLGVQLQSSHPSSFILLADPEFSKLTELTAGLDFAFPSANKIGEWGERGVARFAVAFNDIIGGISRPCTALALLSLTTLGKP
jgi:small ligand-binding sensory domain FIST